MHEKKVHSKFLVLLIYYYYSKTIVEFNSETTLNQKYSKIHRSFMKNSSKSPVKKEISRHCYHIVHYTFVQQGKINSHALHN